MAQITPEDEIIYSFEDRPGMPEPQVSYDDQQHSGLILWVVILLGVLVLAGLAAIVILAVTGRIG